MKKIYYMLLLAALSMTMVSCDGWDSPYYVDDIVGSWESSYGYDGYGEYDIRGYDVVRYDFYANHTGRYTYYDSYWGLSYVDFDWECTRNRLYINYYDGDREFLYYGFDNYGYLILAVDSHFYHYTAYRASGMYWMQYKDKANEMLKEAPADAIKGITKSATRALRAREEVKAEAEE